jgi:hypothetical protein
MTVPSGLTAVTFKPAAIAALIARVIAAWVYGFCRVTAEPPEPALFVSH